MAVQDPTVNYSWDLPTNLGDAGVWGAALRTILGDDVTGIDAIIKAVSDVADAALPLAGGVLTGLVEFLTVDYGTVAKGSVSGAQTLDLATSNFFTITITGATTITFTNPPATGKARFFFVEVTNGGTNVTWGSTVEWPEGNVPSLTAVGTDVLIFYTIDGGTTYRGALSIENFS